MEVRIEVIDILTTLKPYIGLAIVIIAIVILWHLADKGDDYKSKKHKPRK